MIDSAIVLPRASAPRSFAALMTLYESNYLRLTQLIGNLQRLRDPATELVSVVDEDFPLHVSVEDAARYTTTLNMTYYFEDEGNVIADPDISIRIYHDADLAEAMACGQRRVHPVLAEFDTGCGAELRRRWTRNVLLNKWLEYCLDRQHDLATAGEPSSERSVRFVT